MSPEEHSNRVNPLGPNKRTFSKEELARMFKAREEGVSNADIGRRFQISPDKVNRLIGRKVTP